MPSAPPVPSASAPSLADASAPPRPAGDDTGLDALVRSGDIAAARAQARRLLSTPADAALHGDAQRTLTLTDADPAMLWLTLGCLLLFAAVLLTWSGR